MELDEIVRNEQASDPNGGIYPGLELLNQDFNIAAFNRVRDRQILHIATHGVFSPISSYTSSNGANVPDGREISAIAQTFIDTSAGHATVIASLWKVNDSSTSDLMQQFYQTLAQNTPEQRISVAQAMQTAQMKLLRGDRATSSAPLAHPYYWSPFTIIGNGL
jgi:CHAT domain-containing protein